MSEYSFERFKELYEYDDRVVGAKGLVFIGDKVVVYRRDADTTKFPLMLDLPGGKKEAQETPFETFRREVSEEFGLVITPKHITYARKYPSEARPDKFGFFVVAALSESAMGEIVFGDEGEEYFLMDPAEYVERHDAWPVYQEYTVNYLTVFRSPETL